MSKILFIIVLIFIAIILVVLFTQKSGVQSFLDAASIKLDPNLTVFLGYGGNSTILTSNDGSNVLIVDTKYTAGASYLKSQIKNPKVTIVNSHYHKDHSQGNQFFPQATIISGKYDRRKWQQETDMNRYPDIALEPEQEKILTVGDETVFIYNAGQAHTWNDIIVYLKNRKILVAGGLISNKTHPVLIKEDGCNIEKWISILEKLDRDYDVSIVVPGHGSLGDKNLINEMKQYFVSIQSAVKDDNLDLLEKLKRKYDSYYEMDDISSFDTTARFIEREVWPQFFEKATN